MPPPLRAHEPRREPPPGGGAPHEGARPFRTIRARLLADADHYQELVRRVIAEARTSVWIATANVKEMRVEAPVGTRARARGGFQSILDTFESLAGRGVELRLLHGGVPSRAFTAELARHPRLGPRAGALAMRHCPRVHLKLVAVDGARLYLGSANFTGAGLGAKGAGRRNFEMGVMTDDDVLLDLAQQRFERIWTGAECAGCRLRGACPAPLDRLSDGASGGEARRSIKAGSSSGRGSPRP